MDHLQRWAFVFLFCLLPLLFAAQPSQKKEPDYDLLIRNGKIVDGSGNPWQYGDVAVGGSKIVAMGMKLAGSANREIDASGLIVAPGFIDIHSHSDFVLLEDGNAQSKIRQGVTTEVLGESGSAGPYQGPMVPPKVMVKGKETRWTMLGEYFDVVERARVATNVTSFVGLGNIWKSVMGNSHQRPTPEQFERMKALVEEAMKQGAMGLSCALATSFLDFRPRITMSPPTPGRRRCAVCFDVPWRLASASASSRSWESATLRSRSGPKWPLFAPMAPTLMAAILTR
jgi:N-acyl-D-amino-acid deacylase